MAADGMKYSQKEELYMDEKEIIKEYNEARSKREQVTIMAQLNLCPREQILRILILNGVDVSPAGPCHCFGTNGDKTFSSVKRVCAEMLESADATDQRLFNAINSMKMYMEAASKKPKNRRRNAE